METAKEEDEIIFGFKSQMVNTSADPSLQIRSLLEMHSSFDGAVPASSSADTTHLVLFAKLHNDVFLVSKLSVKLADGDTCAVAPKSTAQQYRVASIPRRTTCDGDTGAPLYDSAACVLPPRCCTFANCQESLLLD